jgi:DNA-3-methyladenine glycosylase
MIPPALAASFYEAPVLTLARDLVGKVLVVRSEEGIVAGRIVETEAYRGPDDLAAHSARGRRTKRTEAMFGPAGHAYMFMLYGTSWAFNVVAGPVDVPHAVLVRAVEPVLGIEIMEARRRMAASRRELSNGPGKLTRALGLGPAHYGAPLFGSDVWIADGVAGSVGRSPRINVDYAGAWAKRPWRFFERGNRYVSVAPRT